MRCLISNDRPSNAPVVGHRVPGRQRCRDKRRWRSLRDEDSVSPYIPRKTRGRARNRSRHACQNAIAYCVRALFLQSRLHRCRKPNKCSVSIGSARATIDGRDDQQHRLHDFPPRRFHCGPPGCLDLDQLGCDIFAPCDTSCGLARTGHARGDVENSIIPRFIKASRAGQHRSKAAAPA